MVRRAKAVVVGTVVLVVAGACGDDTSKPKPMNSAGKSSIEAGEAGMANEPDNQAGSGGTAAGGTGMMPPEVVAGNGGDGQAGAPVEASTDVVGQIVAGTLGVPKVIAVVNGIATISDEEGRFTVRNVGESYQLMLRLPDQKLVVVYDGLNTRQPRINIAATWETPYQATLRGQMLNGFADPLPDDADKSVSFVGKNSGFTNESRFPIDNTFDLGTAWDGSPTQEGEIWALESLSNFNDGTYEYTGFGRKKVSFKDKDVLGSVDGDDATNVVLTDPDEVNAVTHAAAPEGWTIDSSSLSLGPLTARLEIPLGDGVVKLPKLDVPRVIQTQASNEDGSLVSTVLSVVPMQGPVKIVHNLPPTLTSPDNKATGINTKTEFFWENMPESSIADVRIRVGDYTILVVTAADSVKLPDLSLVHVRLSGVVTGAWAVTAVGPATTVEDSMAIDDAFFSGSAVEEFQTSGIDREFVTGD